MRPPPVKCPNLVATTNGLPLGMLHCPECDALVGWWSYDAERKEAGLYEHVAVTGEGTVVAVVTAADELVDELRNETEG